jgi:hypothetical protein
MLDARAQEMFDGVRRVRLMLDAADLLLVRSSVADHRIHLTALGLRDERGHHARSPAAEFACDRSIRTLT